MQKRLQNHVAESRSTLSLVLVYAIAVWLMSGLLIPTLPLTAANVLQQGAWPQFLSFLVTTFLMTELNNGNALIRIFSRSIASSYIVLTCAATFLLSSLPVAISMLCMTAFYVMLFHSYQDKQAAGWTFYAFLCIGLASIVFVKIIYFVPLFWIFMFFRLSSLSLRTFSASLLGIITPYWFLMPLMLWKNQSQWFSNHLSNIINLQLPSIPDGLSVNHLLMLLFVVILAITGIVHFWHKSAGDRIRTRQFYSIFTTMVIFLIVLLFLQPQDFNVLLGLLIINTSPLIGHFIALTYTRITNIAFIVFGITALLLTIINLWIPLSIS